MTRARLFLIRPSSNCDYRQSSFDSSSDSGVGGCVTYSSSPRWLLPIKMNDDASGADNCGHAVYSTIVCQESTDT